MPTFTWQQPLSDTPPITRRSGQLVVPGDPITQVTCDIARQMSDATEFQTSASADAVIGNM